MKTDRFWTETEGDELRQGDLLPRCLVPVASSIVSKPHGSESIDVLEYDLLVLTQSCELESKRSRLVPSRNRSRDS